MSQIVANKDNANTAQIQNLLGILATLSGALYRGEDMQGGPGDGGTKTAIEMSMINTCSRLDKMLLEDSRWGVSEYESMSKMFDENTKMIQAQRAAIEESNSPHARYKPTLLKMVDGSWVAICGSLEDLQNAMCGIGDCPAKALEAFDELFKGKVTEALAKILEKHENTKQTLDNSGLGNIEEPKKSKRSRRGNSPEDGADTPVSNG